MVWADHSGVDLFRTSSPRFTDVLALVPLTLTTVSPGLVRSRVPGGAPVEQPGKLGNAADAPGFVYTQHWQKEWASSYEVVWFPCAEHSLPHYY